MLYRSFADPSELTAEFAHRLLCWAVVVVITDAVVRLAERRKPNALSLQAAVGRAGVAYAVIALVVYQSTVAHFTALRLQSDAVVLEFASPHRHQVRIQKK